MGLSGKHWWVTVTVALNLLAALLVAPVGAVGAAASGAATPSGEVELLGSDAQGVRLALRVPQFALAAADAGAACQQAQAAGFVQSEEVGRPQLPVKVVLLGVPPDAKLTLDVNAAPAQIIASGVALCVAQPAPSVEAAGGSSAVQAAAPDPTVYGANAFYPAEAVRLIDLGFMRSQRVIRLEIYPVQFNPSSQELRASAQIDVAVRFQPADGAMAVAGVVEEPAAVEAAFRRSLLNYEAARGWREAAGLAVASGAPDAWTPPQPGYKIAVREAGLYQLTRAALAAAGVPVDQLDPRTLRLFNAEQEVALRVLGEADGKFDVGDVVLFFGQGVDTRYTATNVYWLTYGGAAGLRMPVRNSIAGGTPASAFFATVKHEDNTVYDSDLPMAAGYDHWYGQQITAAGVNKAGSVSITLATPELAGSGADASVSVQLGAITAGSHHVRLYVNPTAHPASIWDGAWDGENTVHLISATFPRSHLNSVGNNTVKIELINDSAGRAADIARVDWVRVGYPRRLVANNDRLLFGSDSTGARRYSVSGFSSAEIELYDVTDPLWATWIDWSVEAPASANLFLPLVLRGTGAPNAASDAAPASVAATLEFGDRQATLRQYLAQTPAQRLAPLSITLDQPSSLQAPSAGADLIIITHADFGAAVQPLANLRRSQGLRVQVVDVQDIYDEFGGGLMSAEAIRDFIAYAYGNWARPAPVSVLLVGDGTYDFRFYRSTMPTYLPPYLDMVDPDAGETATDNRFVAITPGDILPDLDIGRLPVNTPAEATALVNKILAYEVQGAAAWMQQVLFVADDLEGGGGNFYQYSNVIADGYTQYSGSEVKILPPGYTANKIYQGQTCDMANPAVSVECRAQIISKLNAGSLIVSYIGHGTKTYWAAERLYDGTALAGVSNAGRLPIMLPMTCNEGYFVDPAEPSLSELGVRAENKGAIASWSATGYGLAPGHDYLERGLFLALFHDKVALGAAATQGKLHLIANAPPGKYLDLIDTFLLLGDPALRVPVQ